MKECRPCPAFAIFSLAFALQLRKKQEKTSVRVAEEKNVSIHITKKNTHTHILQKNLKPLQYKLKQTVQDIPK
jgi:hypothetical protein